MTFSSRLTRAALFTALATTACISWGQATSSPSKKELVNKVLALQQPALERMGLELANQTANQVLQAAGEGVSRVAPDKREALAKDIEADVRKFYDEISPVLRAASAKIGPQVVGPQLEEKFTEDELKTLVAWLESPVNRKYAQFGFELQNPLRQKLVADSRTEVEGKIQALERQLGAKLQAAGAGAPATGTANGAAAAPAAAASKPGKAVKK